MTEEDEVKRREEVLKYDREEHAQTLAELDRHLGLVPDVDKILSELELVQKELVRKLNGGPAMTKESKDDKTTLHKRK